MAELDRKRRRRERYRKADEGLEMVACKVCGDRFQIIQHSHLRRHGLTMQEYRQKFPDAELMTASMKKARSQGRTSRSKYLSYPGKDPNTKLFEFLTGSLLGDGSLERQSQKRNARYAEGGSNQDYLRYKYELLQEYFPCTWKERLSKRDKRTNKRYRGWWLRSCVHPVLTEWHKSWYHDRIKIVPEELVAQYLTPFALAIWFCDDGHNRGSSSYLYTMGFSKMETEFLSGLLIEKIGLKSKVLFNSSKLPMLRFNCASTQQLTELIKPFALPGMDYKYN